MKYVFGFLLLVAAYCAPCAPADAASRFGFCNTTCTWDNTSTAMWCATDTGCSGASAPVAGDDVTFSSTACVGGTTCTITTFAGTISINSLTMSACTASTAGCILDASANNTNFTIAVSGNAYTNTGAGTRTLNMGGGTWTLSGSAAVWNINTSAVLNAGTSTLAFTGTGGTSRRSFISTGTKTYNAVTVASSTGAMFMSAGTGTTITTLTIAPSNRVYWSGGSTIAITNFTDISGASSTPTLHINDIPGNGQATVSSANNWTCDWCGFGGMTFSGGGAFTANNSANYGSATGITINAPSGGSGGGRIIGG